MIRYNRIRAHVYLSDGTWVEGAMLAEGLAMVQLADESANADLTKMLALERTAQLAKRGI